MTQIADTAAPGDAAIEIRLKQVLRAMPAPVGIVTSVDPDTGQPVGLAMSALMPVCLDPPAMAICVNRAGSAHDAMIRAGRFCINLLHPWQGSHMVPFADPASRDGRFKQSDWKGHRHDVHEGLMHIDGAPAAIFCTIRETLSFGTHDLLVGEVDDIVVSGKGEIVGWANGALCRPATLA